MAKREVTTEYVRGVFAIAPVDTASCDHLNTTPDYAADLFDRWLKTHDAEVGERIARTIRRRLDGHNYDEPWDKGYKVGLRDALEDIARAETGAES